MKTTLLAFHVVYVLLLAHIPPSISRPADRNTYEGSYLNLNQMLSENNAQALLYFLKERFHRNFNGNPRVLVTLNRAPLTERFLPDHQISAKELSQVLNVLQSIFPERSSSAEEVLRSSFEEFSDRLKREDPPISIDLTFHILRQMIEIAKNQNQKQQAEQNRIIFDSLGK
ncbi:urocortin [Microcaecilia unicolor]|uniref:Urocortin n=1 Tax=Microcaecilia unicolor TaxID=1415580 RepID=A0A6P7XCM6_9AMPH|nr:urocortin [Microcaecilia unicolor]